MVHSDSVEKFLSFFATQMLIVFGNSCLLLCKYFLKIPLLFLVGKWKKHPPIA